MRCSAITKEAIIVSKQDKQQSQKIGAKSICVFCGSRPGDAPQYMELADNTGRAIAKADYRLVYGGGGSGLMGATARAAHKAGGDVIGIIPKFLTEIEALLEDVPHEVVPDMHERKRKMYDAADAFIVLPGGFGTMEEVVEIMSWARMRLHAKPIVFLSTNQFWEPLIGSMLKTIEAGFSPEWMRDEVLQADNIKDAMALIEAHWDDKPPAQTVTIEIDEV